MKMKHQRLLFKSILHQRTDAEKIRRDGNIVIGGICRRAYAIKKLTSTYKTSIFAKPNQTII